MKLNFRKISAIASSALMLGMTAGMAAAANYPAPFVVGGSPNVAIVYGSGAAFSDQTAASSIAESLSSFVTGTGTTVTGGDSARLGKTSDEVNLGNDVATVFGTTVDDDELAELLADGTYTDDDNTEYDFTQKVTLGSLLDITHFQDTDYDGLIGASDRTPAIGIRFGTSAHVLNYTLDFSTHPAYNAAILETTTMRLMGRDYYVLDVINGTTNKTTFLDSANSAVVTEGQTTTVAGRSVGINFISSTEVRLDVDGAITNSLVEGATYKLADGTYVGIKDILYDSKEAGISKVEISVGTGKLEVDHGANVELNDVSITEITGFLSQDTSEKLDKITLMWTTDDEEFISPAASLTMPAFEALKFSMTAYTLLGTGEDTRVEGGSSEIEITATIKDGAVTIPILGANSTAEFATIGKDSSNRLYTGNSTSDFTAAAPINRVFNETLGDRYMVLSWNNTRDGESYYLKVDTTTDNNIVKARFENRITGAQKLGAVDDTVSFGNIEITVKNVTNGGAVQNIINFSLNAGSGTTALYTDEGMKIHLPYEANATSTNLNGTSAIDFATGAALAVNATGHNYDSYFVFFDTEDRDGNLGSGDAFNVTTDESGTTNKVHVSAVTTDRASTDTQANGGTNFEIGSTDDFEYYVYTDVATKIVYATGGDYDSIKVTYPGEDSFVNLFLSAPEASAGGGTLGDVLVTDAEVSSVSSKNLVVVGGSCINSAAASLVGGAYCGSAWTSATGVGSGQFLIKGYSSSSITSEMAVLVAGYEAADTTNAATYLRTQSVDTGKSYKGTSATQATLVVA
jgi:hypothetical protein